MDGCVSFKLVNNNHRTEEERLKSEDAFGGQVRWGEGVIGNYWTSSGRGNVNICSLSLKMSSENL